MLPIAGSPGAEHGGALRARRLRGAALCARAALCPFTPSHSHPPIHTISFTGELAELKATVRRQSMALKQQKKENEELQEVSTLA